MGLFDDIVGGIKSVGGHVLGAVGGLPGHLAGKAVGIDTNDLSNKAFGAVGGLLGMGGAGSGAQIQPFTGVDLQAPGQAEQARGQQQDFVNALKAQSEGRGVNLGNQQFKNALNQSIQAQRSAAMSQRGVNPALAAKMAADIGMQQQAQGAGQSALLNMQNQLNAQGQLGGALQGMRGLDITQQQGANELAVRQNLGVGGLNLDRARIEAGLASADSDQRNKILGSILGAAGTIGAGALTGGASMLPAAMGAASMGMKQPGMAMNVGGLIPGYGMGGQTDSKQNDVVPALLSPGEIVLPKSVVNDENAGDRAKMFVEAVKKHAGKSSYGKVVAAKRKTSG